MRGFWKVSDTQCIYINCMKLYQRQEKLQESRGVVRIVVATSAVLFVGVEWSLFFGGRKLESTQTRKVLWKSHQRKIISNFSHWHQTSTFQPSCFELSSLLPPFINFFWIFTLLTYFIRYTLLLSASFSLESGIVEHQNSDRDAVF